MIDDLFYIVKYNPNFVEDFINYIKNIENLTLISATNDYLNKNHVFYFKYQIDNDTAIKIYDESAADLTIAQIQSLNANLNNNCQKIKLIQHLLKKAVTESEYNPKLIESTMHFDYDQISRNITFYLHFTLQLQL